MVGQGQALVQQAHSNNEGWLSGPGSGSSSSGITLKNSWGTPGMTRPGLLQTQPQPWLPVGKRVPVRSGSDLQHSSEPGLLSVLCRAEWTLAEDLVLSFFWVALSPSDPTLWPPHESP